MCLPSDCTAGTQICEKKEGAAMSRKTGLTETILRDAHQSLMATRMKTDDMLSIAERLDDVGYHSLEMWGGATFDSCLRYLNEDPWTRLRRLKAYIKKTPLQMLLRGQNLLGYWHYPDDVVKKFCQKAIENGIDIIRIFDALNDTRNIEVALRATKDAGGHAQACISFTLSPVHDTDSYVRLAKEFEKMGADSICIKDMAGLLSPTRAAEIVRRFKEETKLPVQLHCHYTSGMAPMTYLKAIEAGCDVIDTALSPFAFGSSQPATEVMVAVLKETEFDTGIDLGLLHELAAHFEKVKNANPDHVAPIKMTPEVLTYQIPGGMLSNLRSQLAAQGMLDKWDAVLEEVPRVREECGYPPLVTPMSQIVGTQAVLNVVTGERYAIKSKELKDYLKGRYGRPPGPIDEEFRRSIIGDEEVITVRPADLLEPGLEKAEQEIKQYITKEEDILTYILFPEQALAFFKRRQEVGCA